MNQKKNANGEIRIWHVAGWEQIELHRGWDVARDCPRHWHEEIHICFIEAGGGTLFYRGVTHQTPPGSLFLVHPGETHGNRAYSSAGCNYRTLNASPEVYVRAICEITERDNTSFFIRNPVIFDRDMIRLFTNVHKAFEAPASHLACHSLLLELFALLISRHAQEHPVLRQARHERLAVRRVREYLEDNLAENVLLERLSKIANLSPFYLTRAFAAETGLPPHAYQTQLRVIHAKRLLKKGETLSQVASRVGFADQSHLTRQFKRLVGITPGQYLQSSKNVQDNCKLVQLV